MLDKTSLIITSISGSDNPILKEYAKFSAANEVDFILAGDTKTPQNFHLAGCDYLDIPSQHALPFRLPKLLPHGHYSKKNSAYLKAIQQGSKIILETDDDNKPLENFWNLRESTVFGNKLDTNNWLNVYKHFSDEDIWPRGFSLRHLNENAALTLQEEGEFFSPVQQALADENPDVDAIYRLSGVLPVIFKTEEPIILHKGTICPFNSQNTTWFEEAFPLLYIPSFCSFRMCDIWRSFIAQRIMWENEWFLSFHKASVVQKRNPHDLHNDLEQELEGYIYNHLIMDQLSNLNLKKGIEYLYENLLICYEMMVSHEYIDKEELKLVEAWIDDLQDIGKMTP